MKSDKEICRTCREDFTIDKEESDFYAKIGVPKPEECPRCRQKLRLSFRNFKTLYKRKSDKSGDGIISMYSERSPFPVWSNKEWWADDWDSRDYGREFDFSRPFFDQYRELANSVPRFAVMTVNSTDSEYTNMTYNSKNCYLVFGCVDDEDCAYGHIVWESKQCFDCLYVHKSELCYECVDVLDSYKLAYSQECESCVDSIGLYDCRSCQNCIGCVGLRQKSYHLFNENVGKEGYEKFLQENPLHDPKTVAMIREKVEELKRRMPQRTFFGSQNNNVAGNHIYNGRNIQYGFDIKGGENSRYIYTGRKIMDSYDVSFSVDLEMGYQVITTGGNHRVRFANISTNCSDLMYAEACFNTHNGMGAVGCKGLEYIIFNKQYNKDEFEILRDKIIEHMKSTGEWGKFFPKYMSPFGYNETIAQEYMPLSRTETEKQGFRWEENIPRTSGRETKSHDSLPKVPEEYGEDLAKEILKCSDCGYNYILTPQEIKFYKKIGLSLPAQCFNCRHADRMSIRDERRLIAGKCYECGRDLQTSLSVEKQSKYKTYCPQCYQQHMS